MLIGGGGAVGLAAMYDSVRWRLLIAEHGLPQPGLSVHIPSEYYEWIYSPQWSKDAYDVQTDFDGEMRSAVERRMFASQRRLLALEEHVGKLRAAVERLESR